MIRYAIRVLSAACCGSTGQRVLSPSTRNRFTALDQCFSKYILAMVKITATDLRKKSRKDLQKQLHQLKTELLELRVAKVRGGCAALRHTPRRTPLVALCVCEWMRVCVRQWRECWGVKWHVCVCGGDDSDEGSVRGGVAAAAAASAAAAAAVGHAAPPAAALAPPASSPPLHASCVAQAARDAQ